MRVDTKASFIQFVYPFLSPPERFVARTAAFANAQWQLRQGTSPVWEPMQFPDEELLAHVARYLNPVSDPHATARVWKLNDALQDVYGLAGRATWHLHWPRGQVPFRFGDVGTGTMAVQLALFRHGVGLLTIRAYPTSDTLNDWLDFVHYFRFVQGQRGVGVKAQRRVGFDADAQQPQFSPFFPKPAGGVNPDEASRRTFSDVMTALLQTGQLERECAPWWHDVFIPGQLLPFAALFVDDYPDDAAPKLLYQLRNGFHAGQGHYPASEDLNPSHPGLLAYAERQWFTLSLDGGAFLACDAPDTDFFRQTLPRHLQDQYFLLFQIVLNQRFALMGLSEDVAQHWVVGEDVENETEREAAFDRIRDRLLAFTARGYFVQVMQREHHHRYYRQWQEVFQLEKLYAEVSGEVREMVDYV